VKQGEINNSRGTKVGLSEPYLIDYMAGGALSGGIAWIWSVVLNYLLGLGLFGSVEIFYALSIFVYITIALSTSFLVSKRFEKAHIAIGLKTSLFSWATIIFVYFPSEGKITDATILFYSTLFFCMIPGGYLGGNLSKQVWSREVLSHSRRVANNKKGVAKSSRSPVG